MEGCDCNPFANGETLCNCGSIRVKREVCLTETLIGGILISRWSNLFAPEGKETHRLWPIFNQWLLLLLLLLLLFHPLHLLLRVVTQVVRQEADEILPSCCIETFLDCADGRSRCGKCGRRFSAATASLRLEGASVDRTAEWGGVGGRRGGGGEGLSLYLPVAFRRLPRVRPRRASTAAVRRFLGPIEVKAVGRVDGRRGWGRAALLPLFFPSCLRSVWNRWTQRRGSRLTGEPVAAPLGRLRFIDRSISLGSTRPNSTTLDALLIHGPQSVRGAGKVPPDSVRCHLQRRRWRRPRMRRHPPSCPLHPFHPTRNQ